MHDTITGSLKKNKTSHEEKQKQSTKYSKSKEVILYYLQLVFHPTESA